MKDCVGGGAGDQEIGALVNVDGKSLSDNGARVDGFLVDAHRGRSEKGNGNGLRLWHGAPGADFISCL